MIRPLDSFDEETDFGHYKRRTYRLGHERLVLGNGTEYQGPGTIEVTLYTNGQEQGTRVPPREDR